jgi:flagellar biosynthesis protein FlhB
LLDYAWQRWKYEQDLKMTPEELRRELRESEGDPRLRARRRGAPRQWAENRLRRI